jgi:hypothetical protein
MFLITFYKTHLTSCLEKKILVSNTHILKSLYFIRQTLSYSMNMNFLRITELCGPINSMCWYDHEWKYQARNKRLPHYTHLLLAQTISKLHTRAQTYAKDENISISAIHQISKQDQAQYCTSPPTPSTHFFNI